MPEHSTGFTKGHRIDAMRVLAAIGSKVLRPYLPKAMIAVMTGALLPVITITTQRI